MPQTKPSIHFLLCELARTTTESMTLESLIAAVHAQRGDPDTAPSHRIKQIILENPLKTDWVLLASGLYCPRHRAARGATFRLVPDLGAIAADEIELDWLYPFVAIQYPIYMGVDRTPMEWQPSGRISMQGWMRKNACKPGDHIIVTVDEVLPNTLHFQLERAEFLHLEDCLGAESTIIDALKSIPKLELTPLRAQICVLAIYANAAWRSDYPGRPWQVLYDMALRGISPNEGVVVHLKRDIATLQTKMRLRRATDADRGLWDGMAPRYSAVRLAIDTDNDEGMSSRIIVPTIDTRLDFSSRIEESLSKGLYDVHMGHDDDIDEDDDPADHPYTAADRRDDTYAEALHSDYDDDNDDDDDDSFFDGEGISGEELDDDTFAMLFANRHPALEAWSATLLKSMKPLERRLMVRAESDDDYNAILSVALQRILPKVPALMETLRPTKELSALDPTDGGQTYAAFQIAEYAAAHAIELPEDASSMNDDDVFSTGGEALFAVETALRESDVLIRAYTEKLEIAALAQSTIRRKIQYVRGYSQFLARYYTKSLDAATYATFDEYVFFYYPRHATAIAPRNARDLLSALRDFYRSEVPVVIPVVQALYACRDEAEAVLRLLVATHQYPHEMTSLVVHLFAPYTA